MRFYPHPNPSPGGGEGLTVPFLSRDRSKERGVRPPHSSAITTSSPAPRELRSVRLAAARDLLQRLAFLRGIAEVGLVGFVVAHELESGFRFAPSTTSRASMPTQLPCLRPPWPVWKEKLPRP